jgi:hypothetical protein
VLARDTCDGTERDFKIARLKGGKDYQALVPEVERMVRRHRAAILLIAHHLKQKRFLTGAQTRRLFKVCSGNSRSCLDKLSQAESR